VDFINNWLSFLGNTSSIIGLILTVVVLCTVKSLKDYYVAKATIPHQLNELASLRENIEGLLNGRFDIVNRDKVFEYSSIAHINIQNLLPKLKELNKSQCNSQIVPNVITFNQSHENYIDNPTKDNARTMNRRLFELLNSVKFVIEDENWRRIQ
jgi:hypothetical protein